MASQYHLRNIQRIEKGLHQPGVNLALRLVSAIGLDAVGTGEFFELLWRESAETAPVALRNMGPGKVVNYVPFSVDGLRCSFGPMLLQARQAAGVTQKTIAEAIGYNLRNMNNVETGGQDPGVMTALYMVVAAGVDVREFWARMQAISTNTDIGIR